MRNLIINTVALICLLNYFNQTNAQVNSTIKTNSATGKDAIISSLEYNLNLGNSSDLSCYSGYQNNLQFTLRALLDFDLSDIPDSSTIIGAYLTLFHNPVSSLGNHISAGSGNQFSVKRIISPWTESTVTWLTQPNTTMTGSIVVGPTYSSNQNMSNIDVTNLIQDYINNMSGSFGLLISLSDELPTKGVVFASSDHPNQVLTPELFITYVPNISADFVHFNNNVQPQSINFSDASIGNLSDWIWNFGDSTNSNYSNPNHFFIDTGSFNVCLKITDIYNQSDSICKTVIIGNDSTASIGGQVFANGFPIDIGNAILYTIDNNNALTPQLAAEITNYGYFDFYKIRYGEYYIKTGLNQNSTIFGLFEPTFYGNTALAEVATPILVNSDNWNLDINMVLTSSIPENDLISLRIYPNPVHDILTIDFENTRNESCVIKLSNSLGGLISTFELNHTPYHLNISFLPSGLYTIQIFEENDKRMVVKKFIKI